jgi:hypothetical protein
LVGVVHKVRLIEFFSFSQSIAPLRKTELPDVINSLISANN